ncbi:MAG: hypothetical protein ACF8XB_02245 [Planctomycetota bacterium JB042]
MLPTLVATALTLLPSGDDPHRTPLDRALGGAIEDAQDDLMATRPAYRDHSTWEDPWVVESNHYVVRTVHSRHLGVDIGRSLDLALGWFQEFLGTDWTPSEKLHVHIYPTLAAFNQLGQDINADEHSSFYGAYYASQHADRPLAVMYHGNRTFLKMQATHAALHQFVAGAFNQAPPYWVSEGLASYFAHYWNYAYLRSEHRRLADGDRFVPLRTLTRADAAAFLENPHDMLMELAALFNYLLHRRPDTMEVKDEDGELIQAPFRDLLRGAVRGRNLVLDPTYLSLVGRLPQIEADFRAYVFPE